MDEKSNEITAIPGLPDLLAIEGAIVPIDAMGCQRKIAEKVIDKDADATDDNGWRKKRHDGKALNSIVMVVSSRETAKGVEKERRFRISSPPAEADKLAAAIRARRGAENSRHWARDVDFRDDDCRIRKSQLLLGQARDHQRAEKSPWKTQHEIPAPHRRMGRGHLAKTLAAL